MVRHSRKTNGSGLCECGCGMPSTSRFIKNHYQKSKNGRELNSKSKLGNKFGMIHGESVLRIEHLKFKKNKCEICCITNNLHLHHEPQLNNALSNGWEGKLITLCPKCHKNITRLNVTENMGVYWSLEQTDKLLK